MEGTPLNKYDVNNELLLNPRLTIICPQTNIYTAACPEKRYYLTLTNNKCEIPESNLDH